MSQPCSSYIICGTPRSGSTLLCEMLDASGVAGRPNSYFRHPSFAFWAERWGLDLSGGTDSADFDRAYLSAMQREASNGTGIFGLRLMWDGLSEAQRRLDRLYGGAADIATRLAQVFGPVLYIHLSRRDKLAQAISLVRAEQSGLWHLAADGSVFEGTDKPAPVTYDAARLTAVLAELQADDAAWNEFFATRQIAPLRLTYEVMTADPQPALATILAALAQDPAIARTVSVRTARMSDTTSREWAARFHAEQP